MARIEKKLTFQDLGHISSKKLGQSSSSSSRQFEWVFGEVKNDITTDEYESDFVEECSSSDVCESSSCSDMVDDDDATSSSSHNISPLYELSELMAQLPIKRGLSKYYQGKSESFGSLSNLTNIEDLAKKGNHHRSRRSTNLLGQSQTLRAKGTIVKNKKSCLSSISRTSLFPSLGEMGVLFDPISVQSHF